MRPDEMRRRLSAARVARLATIRSDGRPHVVPMCFALDGDEVGSVVDDKPKRSARLQRLDNVRGNPHVSLLVDHYDDDWTRLWWVRVDGTAIVLDAGAAYTRLLDALAEKYPQYRQDRPPGPVLQLHIERWQGWTFGGAQPP